MPAQRVVSWGVVVSVVALACASSAVAVPITPTGASYDANAFAVDLNNRNDALVALRRSNGAIEVVRRRGADGRFTSPRAIATGRVVAARLGERRGRAIVLFVRAARLREAVLTRRGWSTASLGRRLTGGENLLAVGYAGRRVVAVVRTEGAPTVRVLVRSAAGAWSLAAEREVPSDRRLLAAVGEGTGRVVVAWPSPANSGQVRAAVYILGAKAFRPAVEVFAPPVASQRALPRDIAINARGDSAVLATVPGAGLAAYGYGTSYRQIARLRADGTLLGRSDAVPTDALSLTRGGTVFGVATNAAEAPYDPARDIIRFTRYSSGATLRPGTPLTVLSAERDDVTRLDGVNGVETTTNGLSVVWWNNDPGPGPDDIRFSVLRPGARAFVRVRTAGQSRGGSLVGVGRSRALLVFVDDVAGSGRVIATPIR